MSLRIAPLGLFDSLRRASVMRFVLVLAALLASQNSIACILDLGIERPEAASIEQTTQTSADAACEDGLGDDCCTLCVDCASCGGCHGSALSTRTLPAHPESSRGYELAHLLTAAPALWKPPTLLRPPIDAD
jgi:hypothetical protein